MTPWNNITEFGLGGRLISRSVVDSHSKELTAALRSINEHGAVVSGVSTNVSQIPRDQNAVNPAWRDAVFDAVIGT